MDIYDNSDYNMRKSIGIIPLNPNAVAKVVRTYEICGGSTESIDSHVCENCREQIQMMFDFYKISVEAIDKQVPKKVIPFEGNPYLDACPCCGRIKSIYGDRYCSYCGQRLDWSDDDDIEYEAYQDEMGGMAEVIVMEE